MQLNFLGNQSGFSQSHTNAFFIDKESNSLIIIDLSLLNLDKLLKLHPEHYDNIYLYITHMHDDHSSGIGLLLQNMYYRYNKNVTIISPYNILLEIDTDLVIKGISTKAYNMLNADETEFNWVGKPISTYHCPELINKTFGYKFVINNKIIVYSGDTNSLDSYREILEDADEFYIDTSVDYSRVHLKLSTETINQLQDISARTKVYLMHLDNIEKAREMIKDTPINIVEVFKQDEIK